MDETPPGSASSAAPTPPASNLSIVVAERPTSLRALTSNGQTAGQTSAGQFSAGQTSAGQTSHARASASSSRVVNHAGVPVLVNALTSTGQTSGQTSGQTGVALQPGQASPFRFFAAAWGRSRLSGLNPAP